MIAESASQIGEMQIKDRYPVKKGQLKFPLSTPKRGTVVPKKGNWRSRKGEPLFPQPYLRNLFMILLKYPRPGNERKSCQSGFDEFWRIYPKKVDRGEALRAFVKASENTPFENIIRGAMRYATERTGQDSRFTKHPVTWLSKACWTDPTHPQRKLLHEPRQTSRRFNGSVLERMHPDADFTEVLTTIQTLHRGQK
jgi:hypothetical protein